MAVKTYEAYLRSLNRSKERYHRLKREHPELIMFYRSKSSAKRRGIVFDLKLEDINIPERCPILDIPLNTDIRGSSPSLDRVDNNIGYTKSNVKVISNRANSLKGELSIQDVERLLKYMKD